MIVFDNDEWLFMGATTPHGSSLVQIKRKLERKRKQKRKRGNLKYYIFNSLRNYCISNAVTVIPLITLLIPQAIIAVITFIINSN